MKINQMKRFVTKSDSQVPFARSIRDVFLVEMAFSYINKSFISIGFMQILKDFFRKVFSKNSPTENQILISYLFEIAIRWIYFSLYGCFSLQIISSETDEFPKMSFRIFWWYFKIRNKSLKKSERTVFFGRIYNKHNQLKKELAG